MNTTQTQTAPRKVNCLKCEGRGKLIAYTHVAEGKCFLCHGAKQIAVDAISDATLRATAIYNDLQKNSKYILEMGMDLEYSDDLASLAERCTYERSQVKDPSFDPANIRIIHRDSGLPVTRGEVRAAQAG